jgi:hypothetical protein
VKKVEARKKKNGAKKENQVEPLTGGASAGNKM